MNKSLEGGKGFVGELITKEQDLRRLIGLRQVGRLLVLHYSVISLPVNVPFFGIHPEPLFHHRFVSNFGQRVDEAFAPESTAMCHSSVHIPR